MSSFIAHTVLFENNFTTCRLKGGDNNVYPRPDNWTNPFPITDLIRDLDGRTVQLAKNPKNNKIMALVASCQKMFTERFGDGTDDKRRSIWHWHYIKNEMTAADHRYFEALCNGFIKSLSLTFNCSNPSVDYVAKNVSQVNLFK